MLDSSAAGRRGRVGKLVLGPSPARSRGRVGHLGARVGGVASVCVSLWLGVCAWAHAEPGSPPKQEGALARWLSRPVGVHPFLLEHGVVAPFAELGQPFGYRLGVSVGFLDVLTLGVATQWRTKELGLRLAPEIGVALFRGPSLALGLRYRYLFHAPVKEPEPQEPGQSQPSLLPEPQFFPVTHALLGTMVWSSGYFSAGLEAGALYRRELDEGQNTIDPHLFEMRWRAASGLLLRVGNERVGVVLVAMVPSPEISLRLAWRAFPFARQKRRDRLSVALRRAKARSGEGESK